MCEYFVEIMGSAYNTELDISIFTPNKEVIEYRIYKPNSYFETYLSVVIQQSISYKHFYVNYIDGPGSNNLKLDTVKDLINNWSNLLTEYI